MKNYSVIFTHKGHAQLLESNMPEKAMGSEVLGRTIVSVISNGSETGGFMAYPGSENIFPTETGYANIMEVIDIGDEVDDIVPGDYVFTLTHHRLYNKAKQEDIIKVPNQAPPEKAVLCRFPAVSMTAFLLSSVKPTEPALVLGLGVIGLMCAQVLKKCGYTVYCTDISESRRTIAQKCGLDHVASEISQLGIVEKSIGLCIDCTGNDEAIISSIPYIRYYGELMLVGVPWLKTSDLSAHDFFHQIFYSYLHVISGFEWGLPRNSSEFVPNSNMHSMETAMQWILDGSIKTDGIYTLYDPRDCTSLYPAIAAHNIPTPCCIFDWESFYKETSYE